MYILYLYMYYYLFVLSCAFEKSHVNVMCRENIIFLKKSKTKYILYNIFYIFDCF